VGLVVVLIHNYQQQEPYPLRHCSLDYKKKTVAEKVNNIYPFPCPWQEQFLPELI